MILDCLQLKIDSRLDILEVLLFSVLLFSQPPGCRARSMLNSSRDSSFAESLHDCYFRFSDWLRLLRADSIASSASLGGKAGVVVAIGGARCHNENDNVLSENNTKTLQREGCGH